LIERTGSNAAGSITAIYTILMEGDGEGDPIAEEVRSLTDGHIVLSRKLADAGHYPAIDVLSSLSRLMRDIVTPDHLTASHQLRSLVAKYDEIELLLQVGELKPGQDLEADAACAARPLIQEFCRQGEKDITSFSDMLSQLKRAII
jgi:type III secretion protein N (ATPase)